MTPLGAAAQDSTEIVVTGTRIARDANVEGPAPVQTIGAEDISQGGSFSTIETLNDVPALFFSTTTDQQNLVAGPAGTNTLNLRGMGESRTLTLVNGRRFVAGVEGSQAVDIGGIPQALIQRVEVLTGGASAVYGADAVTGVVNFILREDYEGFSVNVRGGADHQFDMREFDASMLWGMNFAGGRGNITASFNVQTTPGITNADRDWAGNNLRDSVLENPLLRFQDGEINPTDTPTLAAYYNNAGGSGRFRYGNLIPSVGTFQTNYEGLFGPMPALNATEQALFARTQGAYPFALGPQANFSITSFAGTIAPGNFFAANGFDLDLNGTQDCYDSFIGRRVGFELGGCWLHENGVTRPIDDGIITGGINSFGGDGASSGLPGDSLVPEQDRVTLTFSSSYDLTPFVTAFGEFLYARSETYETTPYNTYYDLLTVAPENPFIPADLQAVADDTGGLVVTRDMSDLGPNRDEYVRDTVRAVAGFRGEFFDNFSWEVSANYGEFRLESTDNNYVIYDRVFAAVDAVDDGSGNPICRSESGDPLVFDGSPPPGTPYGVPSVWYPGYYTFTPGDGQCAPLNLFGVGAPSQAAIDFITTTAIDRTKITQTVFAAQLVGDTEHLFSLQGGPISFALGAEYRRETSRFDSNPWDRGILPEGSPFGAGAYVGDPSVSDDPFDDLPNFGVNQSLSPDGGSFVAVNSYGDYDVTDLFVEFSAPIFEGLPLIEELTLDAAYRFSDYSTVGTTDTWRYGAVYAPISDIRFRGTRAQSVRAPNITELFSPVTAQTYRPSDPCERDTIDALALSDPAQAAIRLANCITALTALGVDPLVAENWEDPLTARFVGSVVGNPDLEAETADTTVLGFVLEPRFIPGFTLTVDWWETEIEDPINLLQTQDIVDYCYDLASYPNDYCAQITRISAAGPLQGGFQRIDRTYTNLVRIEAEGVDIAARYRFGFGGNDFVAFIAATKQEKLDFYFDPLDTTNFNPELGEIYRPEWGGSGGLTLERDAVQLGYTFNYYGEQLVGGSGVYPAPEIETYEILIGPSAMADDMIVHNLSAALTLNDTVRLFGGIDNFTDEEPLSTEYAWPVSPRGRFFFVGVTAEF